MAKAPVAKAKVSPKKRVDRRGTPKGEGTIKGGNGGKIGNPPFVATDEQRLIVELCAASGWTQSMIAARLVISEDTLQRHFKVELADGKDRATARLGGVLYEGALAGDKNKMEMWFDRRGGPEWQKKTGVEVSGPGGGAMVVTINGADAKL